MGTCLHTSTNGYFCKYHEGLLYHDDFTSPLAGRYETIDGGNYSFEIVDRPDVASGVGPVWHLSGTKCLRIRYDISEAQMMKKIVNVEFEDIYELDVGGRDFPWIECRTNYEGVEDPDQFGYDLANSGIMHRVSKSDTEWDQWFTLMHAHQCGIFSTWNFDWMFDEDDLFVEMSNLMNYCNNWWGLKHHVDSGYILQNQFLPDGWSVGSDRWEPVNKPWDGTNGNFGFGFKGCASWSVDGYVFIHGVRITETEYITINNCPEDASAFGYPAYPYFFKIIHPGVGATNPAGDVYPTGPYPQDGVQLPMTDHTNTFRYVEIWLDPPIGDPTYPNPVMIDQIEPPTGVNGGDVYWIGEEPPDFPPNGNGNGGDDQVSVPGGCAEYFQIWVFAPVLNDIERGFIPGDTHVIARTFKGFGGDDPTSAELLISTHKDATSPLISITSTPNDNGDDTFDVTFTLTEAQTRSIGYDDALHFQIRLTLTGGDIVTVNAGLIKGDKYELSS